MTALPFACTLQPSSYPVKLLDRHGIADGRPGQEKESTSNTITKMPCQKDGNYLLSFFKFLLVVAYLEVVDDERELLSSEELRLENVQ